MPGIDIIFVPFLGSCQRQAIPNTNNAAPTPRIAGASQIARDGFGAGGVAASSGRLRGVMRMCCSACIPQS